MLHNEPNSLDRNISNVGRKRYRHRACPQLKWADSVPGDSWQGSMLILW